MIQLYIYIYIYIYTHILIQLYICICIYTHIHTYIFIFFSITVYCCFCCLVAKPCPTSCCNLMDCSPLGSPVHGILQARTGVGCHFLLQGIFLTQGMNAHLLNYQVDSLPLSHQGSPTVYYRILNIAPCAIQYNLVVHAFSR